MSSLRSVTDHHFDAEVLQAALPVLVDFWAPWCGPCKSLAPILETLAPDYADKVTILKLDVDENPQTATKYGVRGIPTLILFKSGQVLATCVGAQTRDKLSQFLDAHL